MWRHDNNIKNMIIQSIHFATYNDNIKVSSALVTLIIYCGGDKINSADMASKFSAQNFYIECVCCLACRIHQN